MNLVGTTDTTIQSSANDIELIAQSGIRVSAKTRKYVLLLAGL
jgi:hypothetical protein